MASAEASADIRFTCAFRTGRSYAASYNALDHWFSVIPNCRRTLSMSYIIDPWQAFNLMKASELQGGHPCTRHLGLSNDQLMRRLYESKVSGKIVYISTFETAKDLANAAHQTFKNLNDGEFSKFHRGLTSDAAFLDVMTDQPFKARFAFGSGPRQLQANHMTLVLFRPSGVKTNEFYVKTFFPCPPNSMRENPKAGNV